MKIFQKRNIFIAIVIIALLILVSYKMLAKHPSRKPNIIFITIDALRAGNLHSYGYLRETSPNIDTLANEGTSFLNCFSVCPTTLWSTPTFLTGRYLSVKSDVLDRNVNNLLDGRFTTLAEYLNRSGYKTAAFVNNGNYRKGSGFEQGFDYYKCYLNIESRPSPDRPEELTADVLDFMDNHSKDKPLFVWVHYLVPHTPYNPPSEYVSIFENDLLYKENKKILKLQPNNKIWPYTSGGFIPKAVFQEGQYSMNHYVAQYDAEIRYMDFWIGELLKNIGGDSLIILSSDHGESMGEHNTYFSHGENIYDENLHVPLIIKGKGYFPKGKKVLESVSLLDIVPTVIKQVSPLWYFFNRWRFDGRDLKNIAEEKDSKRNYLFAYKPNNNAFSIRSIKDGFKYISKPSREELYHLPDEDNNLLNKKSPEVLRAVSRLKNELAKWRKRYPVTSDINPEKKVLNTKVRENLKSLGYLQ